jgi:natural product biosynthesis luciferase-like monooxygenase protein
MTFAAALVGNDSLTLACGRMLRDAGHALAAVATRHGPTRAFAEEAGIPVVEPGPGLAGRLREAAPEGFDWLVSAANLEILPPEALALARRGAVNFHDGPLPEAPGLNVPVWALLGGAAAHGITWHLIEGGVDEGPILSSRSFPLADDETALTLNTKCLAAALDSFPEVITQLDGALRAAPQDLSRRGRLRRRDDRPFAGGLLDPARPARDLLRVVRALDHGAHPNLLALPKVALAGRLALVAGAEAAEGAGAPGEVLAADAGGLTVATGEGALRLSLAPLPGEVLDLPRPGDRLPLPSPARLAALDAGALRLARGEIAARARLLGLRPATLPPLGGRPGEGRLWQEVGEGAALALAALAARMAGGTADLARLVEDAPEGAAPWAPLRAEGSLGALRAALREPSLPMAADLAARLGSPLALPEVALGPLPFAALRLVGTALVGDPARLSPAAFALLAGRVAHLAEHLADAPDGTPLAALPLAAPTEAALLAAVNATDAPFDDRPVPDLIAAQAARTPEAPALTFRDRTLAYAEVVAEARRLAGSLRALGVRPGERVALCLPRSEHLVIGALAILMAGGAYVPMDPAYPADRLALYLEDSEAAVVLTDARLAATLPPHTARVLRIDGPRPQGRDGAGPSPSDLAYLIYTSGSTGRPKGVMVTHRNVANFFAGMDRAIGDLRGATWLAVTSLSFDISVLELLWTLARGVHVVVQGDEERALVAGEAPIRDGLDLSLFFWGNDDGEGRGKYRLLLEAARFADAHGFRAVWTPERHFHAFGGPYPNPAVTGAAVAAVTRHMDVRAGSCVAPLHHPLRIAEEWAVVDNLCGGRAGLAIASGWQPEDFVLRPENAVPRNKAAMIQSIHDLRRLWRGEAVEFEGPMGPQSVVTQPRPVSRELPLWITTAGNPDTWREAGSLGANVLTHLLGQTVDEVAGKVRIYHEALRAAGHDPARFTVTLMLHTYLAGTREAAREAAREPMKAYLRSAAALIKQYAWAFPAFKKPQGAAKPTDIDLGGLSPEEMDAILDFAFERYFEESGLFGTVEDALARIEEVRAAGVGEVACLIDYGLATDAVLEGLKPLAEVVARARAQGPAADDFSIAAQVARHGVTHLQCTPSMARMLVTNDDSRAALGRLKHLLVGGEALPGRLARDLLAEVPRVTNMYGPTETTVWSTTSEVMGEADVEGIGAPIVNTTVHVLDDDLHPLPVGEAGELWIGGAGVTDGYWRRPDLTAERFPETPLGRLYRTGDLARWTAEGTLDFLGRADGQVKVRGHRIEAGEVEAALEAIPGVTQAVVVAREDSPGNPLLVAYVTVAGAFDERSLREAVALTLPPHMVPARIVRLDAVPLTPNRKVDRKALPPPGASMGTPTGAPAEAPPAGAGAGPAVAAPAASSASSAGPAAVPSSPAASGREPSLPRVAATWRRLLGLPDVQPAQNFFDLGGHSLLAVQLHRDLRSEFGAAGLSITDIFRFPTLGALAARVDQVTGAAPAAGPAPPRPVATAPTAPTAPTALTAPAVATPPVLAHPVFPLAAERPADPRAEAMARRREMRARRSSAGPA